MTTEGSIYCITDHCQRWSLENCSSNEVSRRVVVGIVPVNRDWEAGLIGQVENVDGVESSNIKDRLLKITMLGLLIYAFCNTAT